jgi:hypothetical protein
MRIANDFIFPGHIGGMQKDELRRMNGGSFGAETPLQTKKGDYIPRAHDAG